MKSVLRGWEGGWGTGPLGWTKTSVLRIGTWHRVKLAVDTPVTSGRSSRAEFSRSSRDGRRHSMRGRVRGPVRVETRNAWPARMWRRSTWAPGERTKPRWKRRTNGPRNVQFGGGGASGVPKTVLKRIKKKKTQTFRKRIILNVSACRRRPANWCSVMHVFTRLNANTECRKIDQSVVEIRIKSFSLQI